MTPKRRILVSNDDGIHARGLRALAEAVRPLGEVWVVAPERQQSAASHAISIHTPVRLKKHGEREFAVEGTPADAVVMGINVLMRESPPDLVVSGINHGPNLAEDVFYSGTVAAAMEGAILGVPAIAFSLAVYRKFEFTKAARLAQHLTRLALASLPAPWRLLNVNVPRDSDGTFRVTRLGRHSYGNGVVEQTDPRGRQYFWLGTNEYAHVSKAGTDVSTVYEDGVASLTPLMMDLTDAASLPHLRRWTVPASGAIRSSGAATGKGSRSRGTAGVRR